MPDREKVIKALECCGTGYYGDIVLKCYECLYGNGPASDCRYNLHQDALALLKEQEAVEPTLIREGRNKYYNDYVCPRCDNVVVYEQNYCSECGAKIDWEGR